MRQDALQRDSTTAKSENAGSDFLCLLGKLKHYMNAWGAANGVSSGVATSQTRELRGFDSWSYLNHLYGELWSRFSDDDGTLSSSWTTTDFGCHPLHYRDTLVLPQLCRFISACPSGYHHRLGGAGVLRLHTGILLADPYAEISL